MSYLYLDHNIYIYALNDSAIREKIRTLKESGVQFVYSPAHIEEIHTAIVEHPDGSYDQTAKELFNLISNTTNNLECLPSKETSVIIEQESPLQCYQRVKQVDTTMRVNNDSELKFDVDKERYQDMILSDKHNKSISTLSCEAIWEHPEIRQVIDNFNQNIDHVIKNQNMKWDIILLAVIGIDKTLPESYKLLKGGYETYKDFHTQLEFSMEILFRILNQNGYNSDKSLHTTISGTHDISHAIYATAAKWLLTTDKRFFAKCKAIYSFLEVPTKIVYSKPDKIAEILNDIVTDNREL